MKLLLSTSNEDKTHELKSLLEPLGHTVYTLKDYGLKIRVEAKGITFFQNALLKAQAVSKVVDIPVLGDESGLVVPALNGEPGVYSARYAGEGHNDADNNRKLMEDMKNVPDELRSCRFASAIALARRGLETLCVIGYAEGRLLHEARGENGFGYDPYFFYPPLEKSFAELSADEKNAVSHRSRSLALLEEALQNEKQ